MRKLEQIIIHCADTPANMDIGAVEIREWHIKERGWNDIGYHFVIRRDGLAEKGREVSVIGAHAQGHNENSIGICLVGGKDGFNFTSAQMHSLLRLVASLQAQYGWMELLGHRDLPGVTKTCPAFDVRAWFSTEV